MAKIIAPAKGYNGTSASVTFEKGVGHTDDPHLIGWFESKGYVVEEEEAVKELETETVPDEIDESAAEQTEIKTVEETDMVEEVKPAKDTKKGAR